MKSSYSGKSGRLNYLLEEVVRFFGEKGFIVSTKKEDSHTVVSVKTSESGGNKILDVCLAGDVSGSLTVTFDSLEGSPFVRNSAFLSLLGGGFLTLRKLRMSEIIERLEKEFWEMVDGFMVSS